MRGRTSFYDRIGLTVLIWCHVFVCCLSLVYVARFNYGTIDPATFHFFYDPARLHIALGSVAVFTLLSSLFLVSKFSFGYFIGFYFYAMTLSYIWLSSFSDLKYDHTLAGISAILSLIVFLFPALMVTSPISQVRALTISAYDRLLTSIIYFAIAVVAFGGIYSFNIVGLDDIYTIRQTLDLPRILNYLIPITRDALLPFVFAGCLSVNAYCRAVITLIILACFYPITLSKLSLFAPFWLAFLTVLTKIFECRVSAIVSLLGPMLLGVVLIITLPSGSIAEPYFSLVNFRMLAIPALALDIYNDFFSQHEVTRFCQISFLKPMLQCPYQEQLSVVMARTYGLGNFNASLFATEGIASVSLVYAPVTAFLCGLVFALGNRLSAGLPCRFVFISAALVPQVLLNVPLSTALLTHGLAILFLLWHFTPRDLFEHDSTE